MATTILDNEAVQALVDPRHRKHRRTNRATLIRRSLGVSVTDATVGELIESCTGPIQVITSDRDDSDRMASYLGRSVEIIVL